MQALRTACLTVGKLVQRVAGCSMFESRIWKHSKMPFQNWKGSWKSTSSRHVKRSFSARFEAQEKHTTHRSIDTSVFVLCPEYHIHMYNTQCFMVERIDEPLEA